MKRFTSVLLSVLIVLSLFTACFVSADAKTTTDHRYKDEYNSTFEKYPDFQDLAKENFPIPGLETTDVIHSNACMECHDMVPQGICTTEDYILITAYCSEEKHNSVIYVIDKSTKSFLVTLTLEDKNHVGGIAYDGTYIWVAKSTEKQLSAILPSTINSVVASNNIAEKIEYYASVDCGCKASFLTYFNGNLWVGVFEELVPSFLCEVELQGNNKDNFSFEAKRNFLIPIKANGAAFASHNGETELVVNVSNGRKNDSQAYVYSVDFSDTNILGQLNNLLYTYTLPPMAEEICVDGEDVYIIFESGATKYSTEKGNKCEDIVDSVCVSDIKNWFGFYSQEETENEFKYIILKNGTVEITRYTGSAATVTIPSKIDGRIVSSIGIDAFQDCKSLKSINIPESVTSIDYLTFAGCTSLEKIDVDINNKNYCSINGNLYNKEKTTLILYAIGKNETSFTIPNSVTNIGIGAFSGCEKLTSVTIGNSVTSIENAAFSGCERLTSITIGNSVTSIGDAAFGGCTSLKSVDIPDSVMSIGAWAFEKCTSLENLRIGNSVTSIGIDAFSGCERLKSIDIPDSVTSIKSFTFYYCLNLTSVKIGNSVTSIENDAFCNCINLTKVNISSSVTSIENDAFENCESLLSVTIPESVKYIGESAFEYCEGIKDVYFLGTENEWNEIQIGDGNDDLINANIHFGSPSDSNATTPDVTEPVNYDGEFIPGDVNYDGKVNMKDVTRLQKYINKWDVEIKEENCDVNGDNKITMKDIILLQKYINKWDVVLK